MSQGVEGVNFMHAHEEKMMEPLARDLEDRTFQYHQVCRAGMSAIYTQTHKASGIVRYEVIRIRATPETQWPDGRITPAHEAYPGATTWGTWGWTFFHLAEAQQHMATVMADTTSPEEAAIETEAPGE